jgi:hypothetical protein
MRPIRPVFISVLGIAFSMFFASSLLAQRAFVSAVTGNDANPCTRPLPCRSFGAAIATVAAGGEVVVDSGGYGPFTVSKAVTVESPAGIYAGVSATSGDGIDVSAGASDIVVLRNLTVYGFGSASTGISFLSGAALYIESCIVNGFHSYGINHSASADLFVTDTTVRNGGFRGIQIGPSAGSVASLDHCRMYGNNSDAVVVFDNAKVNVRDSVASSKGEGFTAAGNSTVAELNIENCVASNNIYGILTSNNVSTIRVSGSTVTNNGTGLAQFGAMTLGSYGNNHVAGNSTDISGTITALSNN